MDYNVVTSVDELRNLYGTPSKMVVDKQQDQLDEYSEQYLSLSPFVILSTTSLSGLMDCSPKGDYPGFIQCLDKTTIAIPDRPGNNRLDSLVNIVENPKVGLLFMIPGFKECLRINGNAHITTDDVLLKKFEVQNKLPRSVILVSILEVYFHCAKAIARSKLWELESQVDRKIMPSLGRIIMAQVKPDETEEEIQKVEAGIEQRLKTMLY